MQRKQLAYWVAQFSGWGFYIFISGFSNYLNNELSRPILAAFLALFVSGIVISHLMRTFIVHRGWLKFSLLKLFLPVVITTGFFALVLGVLQLSFSALIVGRSDIFASLNFSNGFVIWLNWWMILMIWCLVYFAFHFFERSRNEEIKNLRLEAMRTEVELNNLKSQLNPHFMFNSMNSIRALIDENPVIAKESITKLSNILRNTLLMGRKRLVGIEEELSLVEDYLRLEQVRYEERLRAKVEMDPSCIGCLIPPLMVQTLVENGIKHGISKLPLGGEINVIVSRTDRMLSISVENTGTLSGSDNPQSTGIGIANTRQRLELIYEGKATFDLFASDGKVHAHITLPIQSNL